MLVKQQIRSLIRSGLRAFGYDICRAEERRDPFQDMRRLSTSAPTIFDVGANVGQTIQKFKETFPGSAIHAFEPSPNAFSTIQRIFPTNSGLHLNNFGLGSQNGTFEFLENSDSRMSSFLELGPYGWGRINHRTSVQVRTIDDYCAENDINMIDILKIDTQGYDLEVMRGAKTLFEQRKIHLIFVEITFFELYKGLPRFDEIFSFLVNEGFSIVAFYRFFYRNSRVAWTDVLFVRD